MGILEAVVAIAIGVASVAVMKHIQKRVSK